MKKRVLIVALLELLVWMPAVSQDWMRVHLSQFNTPWMLPMMIDSIREMTLTDQQKYLQVEMHDGFTVPLTITDADSISFEEMIEEEVKDKYQVFQLFIYTENGRDIVSKEEYVPCYVGVNGRDSYACRWLRAGIRGRGNSTWLWYDKKPYRIKFDHKQKVLGLDKAKSWVLLANYRDITDVMNTFVFELGRMMGLPFTNHSRYVEVLLNGEYIGVYQLTEQVQQGSNRVDISDDRGILLSLDKDDGPELDRNSKRNFWSSVYSLPVAVKYPEEENLTKDRLDSIRSVFSELENAIQKKNFTRASQLMDMESFARYILIQEFVYNVEIDAPRSIFLHKDGDGRWVMGPLWDFDAGYDFDWGTMYTGHDYFANYKETVMGTNPVRRNGNYPYMPRFFTDLFGTREFVQLYKQTWQQYSDSIVSRPWQEVERYTDHLNQGAMEREATRWPVNNKTFRREVLKMHQWLMNRRLYMDNLIKNIPEP